MHQKILGNRMPIEEEELIEYIIDGIPDRELKNQTRVDGLKTKTLFERIELWDKKYMGRKSADEKSQFWPKVSRDNEGEKSEQEELLQLQSVQSSQ